MSDAFSADWLALREPADHRARNARLRAAVLQRFAGQASVAITDLGCGTGSTLRNLGADLPSRQLWRLVDRDAGLLQRVRLSSAALLAAHPSITLQPEPCDMQQEIERLIALPADLVTLSAFLDLASSSWIDRLAEAAARHRRPVYAALSFDGRMQARPADPFDTRVFDAFHQHQQREKGLGAALGPAAAAYAVQALEMRGFRVEQGEADWALHPGETDLQTMLLDGWVQAARETGLLEDSALAAWAARRRQAIASGLSRLTVGHIDIWATPA